jgi:hypothetical protein
VTRGRPEQHRLIIAGTLLLASPLREPSQAFVLLQTEHCGAWNSFESSGLDLTGSWRH